MTASCDLLTIYIQLNEISQVIRNTKLIDNRVLIKKNQAVRNN